MAFELVHEEREVLRASGVRASRGIAWRARVLRRIAGVSWRHHREEMRLRRAGRERHRQSVLLVVGCQRSGTTLMTRLLAADPEAKIYPEHSLLSLGDLDEHLRLAPLASVRRRIALSRFPFVVLKPLVESQNTRRILDGVPNARALWMVRHYLAVARSNLSRFGMENGVRNLRLALEAMGGRDGAGWRGERASAETLHWLRESFSTQMNPLDAAALFWVVRNQLFFDQHLAEDERVRALDYEDLTADPAGILRALYAFAERDRPEGAATLEASGIVRPAGDGSAHRAVDALELSPNIRERCESMWARLQALDNRILPCASSS